MFAIANMVAIWLSCMSADLGRRFDVLGLSHQEKFCRAVTPKIVMERSCPIHSSTTAMFNYVRYERVE